MALVFLDVSVDNVNAAILIKTLTMSVQGEEGEEISPWCLQYTLRI